MAPVPSGHSKAEALKAASDHLRGGIRGELDGPAVSFSGDTAQLLKFHGVYQQDDRDVRAERRRRGLDVDHICMVRVRIPGGILTPDQYLALDRLADTVGNGTLRVTTRQGIQYHVVRKHDLRALVAALDDARLSTLGACGDVVRNVMCCPAPLPGRGPVHEHVEEVARRFRPRTGAYAEVWLGSERVETVGADAEPLYGDTYLPRKFKIGVAFPGDNCVDVYTHDVGIVPALDGGRVRAFTLLAGGGMGRSHNDPATFARLADPLATVAPAHLADVVEAVVSVQRDHGDRAHREHARLKYLVHEWGIGRFRDEVGRRTGHPLAGPEPVVLDSADEHLGWHVQDGGRWFLGVKTGSGRIADRRGSAMRAGLRAVVERFGPGVRLTPREDVLLTDIDESDRADIDAVLAGHGVQPADQWAPLARHAFACPALPTCGQALAESERALPDVIAEIEAESRRLGIGHFDAHVRMTGCPNGCARPYTAEIGIVGRAKRRYDLHLGGEPVGNRLNTVFAEDVPVDRIVEVLRPLLTAYRDGRDDGERFGDFCHRTGVDVLRARFAPEPRARRSRRPAAAPNETVPAP